MTAIGVEASITSNNTSPTGITVNAGAGDVVTLRGLTLFSGAASGNGIVITAGKSVTLRDCTISGFPADGIDVDPSASLDLGLRGVSVSGNGGDGLSIFPSGTGAVTVAVTDSQVTGNGAHGVSVDGEFSTGTIKATLSVLASANGGDGIIVGSTASNHAQPVVMITGSKLVNSALNGLLGHDNVQVFVDRTQISGNSSNGWEARNSAAVKSYANNEVNGNGNDTLNSVVQTSSQ